MKHFQEQLISGTLTDFTGNLFEAKVLNGKIHRKSLWI